MGDFILDHFGWFLAGLVAILLALAGVVIAGGIEAEREFMAECLLYHKQYECTAMWRAGDTDVVAVPVVVPIR